MVTSYLRLKRPRAEAMARYGQWIGVPEVEPARLVTDDEYIDLALHDGDWRGLAVYIYEAGEWTVFEEVSGGLGDKSASEWLSLADGGDLIYAGYNDAIGYGELICIAGGNVVRHFLDDDQDLGHRGAPVLGLIGAARDDCPDVGDACHARSWRRGRGGHGERLVWPCSDPGG